MVIKPIGKVNLTNLKKVSAYNLIASLSLLVLLVCSCKEKHPEIPADIIPVDSMVHIQADVELIEAYLLTIRLKRERDSIGVVKYNELYAKHGLTRESYQKNLQYYLDHEIQMRELYTKTLEELNKREAELKAGKKN